MPAKHQPDCALLKASNSKNTLSNTEPKNIDANDNKAATLKNTKSSSADPFSSVPSLHRLLIDKIPAKVCRVRFFANGDRFFSGLSYVVNLERIRTLDLLCADLSRLLVNLTSLPSGVRIIFSCENGKKIESIQHLKANGNYVCSSNDHFVRLSYTHSRASATAIIPTIESRNSHNKPSTTRVCGKKIQPIIGAPSLKTSSKGDTTSRPVRSAYRDKKPLRLESPMPTTPKLLDNTIATPAKAKKSYWQILKDSSNEEDHLFLEMIASMRKRSVVFALLRAGCNEMPGRRPTREVYRFGIPRSSSNFRLLLKDIATTMNTTESIENIYCFRTGQKVYSVMDFCEDDSLYLVSSALEQVTAFDYLLDNNEYNEIVSILGDDHHLITSGVLKLCVKDFEMSIQSQWKWPDHKEQDKKAKINKTKQEDDAFKSPSPRMLCSTRKPKNSANIDEINLISNNLRSKGHIEPGQSVQFKRLNAKQPYPEPKYPSGSKAKVEFKTPLRSLKKKEQHKDDNVMKLDLHECKSPKSMMNQLNMLYCANDASNTSTDDRLLTPASINEKYLQLSSPSTPGTISEVSCHEDFYFKTPKIYKTDKKLSRSNVAIEADSENASQDLIGKQLISNLGSTTTTSSLSSTQSGLIAKDLAKDIQSLSIYTPSASTSSQDTANMSAMSASPKDSKQTSTVVVKSTKRFKPNKEVSRLYELGDVIGEGKFGVVYNCKKRSTRQKFALKVVNKAEMQEILPNSCSDEGRLLEKLDHPNIIRLYQNFDFQDQTYLVLELFKDGDLFDAITLNKTFPELESAKMVNDLMQGVLYLHNHNIIHRDIKLENLMVKALPMIDPVTHERRMRPSLKLADFGLAVEIRDNEKLFTICGTPTYVAPEILLEIGYSYPVDVWASGVIAYILLAGYPPFGGDIAFQDDMFDQIIQGRYDFDHPVWETVSSNAKQLISFMLNTNTELRLTSREVLAHSWVEYYNDKRTDL